MSTAAALGIVLLVFAFLGIPVLVSLFMHPHRWWLVALISLISGWTIIGWIVALYIAIKHASPLTDEYAKSSAPGSSNAVMVTVDAGAFRGKGYAEWNSSGISISSLQGNPCVEIAAREIVNASFTHSTIALETAQHGLVRMRYGSLFHRIEGAAATLWGGSYGTPISLGGRLYRTEGGVVSPAVFQQAMYPRFYALSQAVEGFLEEQGNTRSSQDFHSAASTQDIRRKGGCLIAAAFVAVCALYDLIVSMLH